MKKEKWNEKKWNEKKRRIRIMNKKNEKVRLQINQQIWQYLQLVFNFANVKSATVKHPLPLQNEMDRGMQISNLVNENQIGYWGRKKKLMSSNLYYQQ